MNTQDFNLEVDPVIQFVSQAWDHWLTPKVVQEYQKNSFFSYNSVTHPDTNEEFRRKMSKTRIIALNTQNCYFYNFYLIGQFNDPGQQFEWLENLLRQMEQEGEVGIIIGHMSPGVADCIDVVSVRLRALADRFQHVIRLNLFGHTHNEEIEVIRSVEDGKPIGVNQVAPAFTTFTGRNPSFRAITLDVKTKLPVKIETYTFELSKANQDDAYAKFVFNHEMSEDYGMPDLSPQSFLDLTTKLRDDEQLAIKYLKNMSASGRNSKGVKSCDEKCRRMLSCHSSNSVYGEARKCYNIFDLDSKVIQSYLFEFVYGPWVNRK